MLPIKTIFSHFTNAYYNRKKIQRPLSESPLFKEFFICHSFAATSFYKHTFLRLRQCVENIIHSRYFKITSSCFIFFKIIFFHNSDYFFFRNKNNIIKMLPIAITAFGFVRIFKITSILLSHVHNSCLPERKHFQDNVTLSCILSILTYSKCI